MFRLTLEFEFEFAFVWCLMSHLALIFPTFREPDHYRNTLIPPALLPVHLCSRPSIKPRRWPSCNSIPLITLGFRVTARLEEMSVIR